MSNEVDIWNIPVDEPKRRMAEYSYTIYGQPKFGKSGLASCFPDPLFFCFEAGQNALRARKLQVADWRQFVGYIDAWYKGVKEGKEIPYKNFIIDTSDIAWKYCVAYVCKKNGWSDPSEAEWGAGWRACADEWFSQIDRLEKLGTVDNPCRVINVCHHSEKEFKPKNKPKYNKIVPDIPQGGRDVIVDKVDFIIYCDVDTVDDGNGNLVEKRRMYLRDNGEYEAGSRLRFMPNFIEYGDSPQEAFNNFAKAFEEAVEKEFGSADGSIKPSTPPTPTSTKKAEKSAKKSEKVKVEEKPPVEETNVGKEPETPKETPKKEEVASTPTVSLDSLKKEIASGLMKISETGKMSAVDIVAMIEKHTGQKRASAINDAGKAQALLGEIKELLG